MALDDDFPIRQVLSIGTRFCCWAHWPQFSMGRIVYYMNYMLFYNSRDLGNGE